MLCNMLFGRWQVLSIRLDNCLIKFTSLMKTLCNFSLLPAKRLPIQFCYYLQKVNSFYYGSAIFRQISTKYLGIACCIPEKLFSDFIS